MNKPKILVIFTKHKDFTKMGKVPSVRFFGYDKLVNEGDWDVERLEIYKQKNPFWILRYPLWLLWRPFELYLYRRTSVGFSLGQLIHHLRKINRADVVYCQNDSSGLPLALLKRLGLVRPKIFFISAGLVNNLVSYRGKWTHRFFRWVLKGCDLILAWSPLERDMFRTYVPGVWCELIPLEPDIKFYKPNPPQHTGDYILSIGRDPGRDVQKFLYAVKWSEAPTRLITTLQSKKEITVTPHNVTITTDYLSYDEIKKLINDARIVVIPIKEISRISGQTVLLDNLAMGKAIIVARTRAMMSTYPDLMDQVIWYTPGDVEDMRSKIKKLYDDQERIAELGKKARVYAENFSQGDFYPALKQHIISLLLLP